MDTSQEREVFRIDERDALERKHAAAIRRALQAQLNAVLPDDISDEDIWRASQKVDENSSELEAAIIAILLASLSVGVAAGVAQLGNEGLGIDEAAFTVNGQEWARRRAKEALRLINATTSAGIAAAVSDWVRQQARDMADLKKELAVLVSRSRAENISTTEGTGGFNHGNAAAAAAAATALAGLAVVKIEWYTMQDERVCLICLPRHAQQRTVGGSYPDGYGAPPAHPRCRCGERIVINAN